MRDDRPEPSDAAGRRERPRRRQPPKPRPADEAEQQATGPAAVAGPQPVPGERRTEMTKPDNALPTQPIVDLLRKNPQGVRYVAAISGDRHILDVPVDLIQKHPA